LHHVPSHQQHVVLEQYGLQRRAAPGAVALARRRQHADGAEHAAHDVVDAGAGAQRVARAAGHAGQPAHHLHHLVRVPAEVKMAVHTLPSQDFARDVSNTWACLTACSLNSVV
jgi:hypothetical protein